MAEKEVRLIAEGRALATHLEHLLKVARADREGSAPANPRAFILEDLCRLGEIVEELVALRRTTHAN